MKHIQESIIGRKGGQTSSLIYQLEQSFYDFNKTHLTYFSVLYLNEIEYDIYLEDIMTLPGLKPAQKYLKSVHDEGGDVIIWAEKNNRFSPAIRFFLQSTKLMYGVDHIRNLPAPSIPQPESRPGERHNTFKITKIIGGVDLSKYKNIYDCFVKNNLINFS